MQNTRRQGTIYLIGMMGAGKTFRARSLSAFLNRPWFDTDEIIERETGKTISDIFAEPGGEAAFRLLEHQLLQRCPWPAGSIVACGGGMPCFHGNLGLMQQNGTVIWLNPAPNLLAGRLWQERMHRPVVASAASRGALELRLEALLVQRTPFYRLADIEIAGNPSAEAFHRLVEEYLAGLGEG